MMHKNVLQEFLSSMLRLIFKRIGVGYFILQYSEILSQSLYVHLIYLYFWRQIFKQQFLIDIKRDKIFIFKKDEILISISTYFAKSLVSARSCSVFITPALNNRILFENSVLWVFSNWG